MRGSDYMANEENGFQKNNIHWYPGHMMVFKKIIFIGIQGIWLRRRERFVKN